MSDEKKVENKEEPEKQDMSTETPEEEKKEDPKEEEKETPEEEKKEEKFDFSIFATMFEGEECYGDLYAEFAKGEEMNYAKCMNAMYAKFCNVREMCTRMSGEKNELAKKFADEEAKSKAYMAENEELKKFKAEKEQEQFAFAVDSTLKEIEDKVEISQEELDVLRLKSKEFSMKTIDAWRNLAKARALDFAVKEKKTDGVVRMGFPFSVGGNAGRKFDSPWKRNN